MPTPKSHKCVRSPSFCVDIRMMCVCVCVGVRVCVRVRVCVSVRATMQQPERISG